VVWASAKHWRSRSFSPRVEYGGELSANCARASGWDCRLGEVFSQDDCIERDRRTAGVPIRLLRCAQSLRAGCVPHELSRTKLRFRLARNSGGTDPSARALNMAGQLSANCARASGWDSRLGEVFSHIAATRWRDSQARAPVPHLQEQQRLCSLRLAAFCHTSLKGSKRVLGSRDTAAEPIPHLRRKKISWNRRAVVGFGSGWRVLTQDPRYGRDDLRE
jgi:hypothetical protein